MIIPFPTGKIQHVANHQPDWVFIDWCRFNKSSLAKKTTPHTTFTGKADIFLKISGTYQACPKFPHRIRPAAVLFSHFLFVHQTKVNRDPKLNNPLEPLSDSLLKKSARTWIVAAWNVAEKTEKKPSPSPSVEMSEAKWLLRHLMRATLHQQRPTWWKKWGSYLAAFCTAWSTESNCWWFEALWKIWVRQLGWWHS